ncbi:MAG: CoA pyrophosphatase [Rhodospirillales bacterium]|nr:CoA pyrophosphatase [Rhodospirillales bacterium]
MEQRHILSPRQADRSVLTRDVVARRLARAPGGSRRSDAATARRLGADAAVVAAEYPPETQLVPAAVLVPLVERDEGWTVLLTQRTAHLSHHAGQISFPGGRIEDGDEDALAAALRETEEEIGLSRNAVDLLGWLDDYVTGTGFRVTPVVGLIRPPFTLVPDPFEVADAFEVPLSFILDPGNHQQCSRVFGGRERRYYAMPYEERFIWGATAGMLINLYEVLSD